jgi:hypothetical protein
MQAITVMRVMAHHRKPQASRPGNIPPKEKPRAA